MSLPGFEKIYIRGFLFEPPHTQIQAFLAGGDFCLTPPQIQTFLARGFLFDPPTQIQAFLAGFLGCKHEIMFSELF
eukprot:UN01320